VNETATTENKATEDRPQVDPKDLPPLVMNREAGFACLQRVVVKLLQHAGFESMLNVLLFDWFKIVDHINKYLYSGGSSMAVNILTEVAQDYLLNLGKTMRAYIDDVFNKKMPEVNIIYNLFIFDFCIIIYFNLIMILKRKLLKKPCTRMACHPSKNLNHMFEMILNDMALN
jgi:hypothetical protein